ncbi:MAG: hypothetical protein HWN67_22390 [Candidatus Helarchaeota archaeon]|nr:hypothetical protein [Candidatus Helarchaeota archaeon]
MEEVNELIKKIETLSESEIELKSVGLFDANLDSLKKLFAQIQAKSKETQDFINQLDLSQIVEASMDYLADEFYDKFTPAMKFLDSLVKKSKKEEFKNELEDLRIKLRKRISEAQSVFDDTIGQTPFKLEQMESLVFMREKLVPQLEDSTEKLNQNVSGMSEEIKTELSSNYKMLLDSLNKLKGQIKAAEEEVEKLASTSKWIKEQLELREQELADKSEEAAKIKEKLDKREEELESVKQELQKELADREAESQKIKDSLKKREEELEALKEESGLSKKELQKRQKELEEQIQKTKEELEQKSSESDDIKSKLAEREQELTGVIDKTRQELEAKATESEKFKDEVQAELEQMLKDKTTELKLLRDKLEETEEELEKQLEEKSSELETLKKQLTGKDAELGKQLEEKSSELELLKKQIDEKEKKLDNVQKETTKELEGKTSEIESLTEQLNKKDQEVKNMQSQIVEKEEVDIDAIKNDIKKEFDEISEKLRMELDDVIQFLEKSPKYQLLYLINNEGETSLSKVQDLYKIDEVVTRTLLDDLSKKGYISIKEEKDDFVLKIEQKLNPLSFIELEDIFESNMYIELQKLSDISSINEFFDICIDNIDKHREKNKEEAGFLLSLLYLYIYKSKNFELFNKIRPLYNDLKPKSFYIRLVENTLTYDPWESKKSAILENLMDMPKLNILNTKYTELTPSDEAYPKDGPFSIKKYQPLTLIDWDEQTIVEKSTLNRFVEIQDLAKWVWLNGKGANFKVDLVNSAGKKYQIIISASKKTDAHLVIKTNELIAS